MTRCSATPCSIHRTFPPVLTRSLNARRSALLYLPPWLTNLDLNQYEAEYLATNYAMRSQGCKTAVFHVVAALPYAAVGQTDSWQGCAQRARLTRRRTISRRSLHVARRRPELGCNSHPPGATLFREVTRIFSSSTTGMWGSVGRVKVVR